MWRTFQPHGGSPSNRVKLPQNGYSAKPAFVRPAALVKEGFRCICSNVG
jgi:hypothetical protein